MANTEIWVGLDTNATAGRDEAITNESGSHSDVAYEVHDVQGILARSRREENCRVGRRGNPRESTSIVRRSVIATQGRPRRAAPTKFGRVA